MLCLLPGFCFSIGGLDAVGGALCVVWKQLAQKSYCIFVVPITRVEFGYCWLSGCGTWPTHARTGLKSHAVTDISRPEGVRAVGPETSVALSRRPPDYHYCVFEFLHSYPPYAPRPHNKANLCCTTPSSKEFY